ncbi:helix-turn-helix domain-containing protein [Kribbella sp. NPDC056861]|uniref:helix-turn-helix domain-containing protein n=1 Tax=Kribbella sp. NPDC056861 TaxID=3154857 RepID=UPI003417F49F
MLRIRFTTLDLATTTVSVAPCWPSGTTPVGAVPLAGTDDIDRLLAELHPRVRWTSPVLQVLDLDGPDLALAGRGLRLQLYGFRWQAPAPLRDPAHPPVLGVPIPRPTTQLPPVGNRDALVSLLGTTRAAALEACFGGCTSTGLAKRCSVSIGAASYHAAVLRKSGLITTRRTGSSVLHEVTPLGFRLLIGGLLS